MTIAMTPWTGSDALLGGDAPHTGLAWLDLDDDRDPDLVLSAEGSAPQAILNDRLGRFHASAMNGLASRVADAGLFVTDLDHDGRPDLVARDSEGKATAWANRARRNGVDLALAFERWPCNGARSRAGGDGRSVANKVRQHESRFSRDQARGNSRGCVGVVGPTRATRESVRMFRRRL
jgi:hypothetical protein